MPRRAAIVTQADIARTIRAMKDAGLEVHRIIVRPDGVAVEAAGEADEIAPRRGKLAGDRRTVVL